MEKKSDLVTISPKVLRVVQMGGRIFYHGQCYLVPAELAKKRVRLVVDVADPNNLNVISPTFSLSYKPSCVRT